MYSTLLAVSSLAKLATEINSASDRAGALDLFYTISFVVDSTSLPLAPECTIPTWKTDSFIL